ncbi:lyase [Lithospermum erythrorhizon]|uniref:Lyase n=1 Tax=Lithospermum erythrorhizon TaxID=34254 RepID=A0AAV3RVF7_LITER
MIENQTTESSWDGGGVLKRLHFWCFPHHFRENLALRRLGVKSVEIKKPEQLQSVNYLIIPGGESTTMAKLAEYHNLFPALREFVKTGKPVWGTCAGLIFLANRATGQKLGGQDLIGGLDCMVHRNFFGSQLQSFETELAIPHVAAKEGGPPSFRGVFIRAPAILEVGPEVEVLADFPVPPEKNISSNPAVQTPEVASYLLSCYPLCDIFSSPKPIYTSKHSTSTRKRSAQIHSVLLCKENTDSLKKVIVAVRQGNLLATAFHPELTADTRWHSYFLKMGNDMADEASTSSSLPLVVPNSYDRNRIDLPIFQ